VGVHIATASASILLAMFSWGRRHFRLAFTAGLTGCLLLGCAADYGQGDDRPSKRAFPLPNQTLLAWQPEPGCLLKTSNFTGRKDRTELPTRVADLANGVRSDVPTAGPSGTTTPERKLVQTNSDASLAERIKLEYERDCLQRAETRVREKLSRLQSAVRKTIRAIRYSKQNLLN
jgi:hypothetical protein